MAFLSQSGAYEVLWTDYYDKSNAGQDVSKVNVYSTLPEGSSVELSLPSWAAGGLLQTGAVCQNSDLISFDNNWFTLNYKITLSPDAQAYSVNQMTFSLVTYAWSYNETTSNGDLYSSDTLCGFYITDYPNEYVNGQYQTVLGNTDASNLVYTELTVNLEQALLLSPGASKELYIGIGSAEQTILSTAAVQSITFLGSTIPEPTTATLSLLTLTALVARRRRK